MKLSTCPHCYQTESDCDCAGEWHLVLQALGMDHEVTLAEAAQAAIAESRYTRAAIDAQLRRTYHALGGKHAQAR